MRRHLIVWTTSFLALACIPAHADTGPCKPYPPLEVLVCGMGEGAAIVIRDTVSPSKKLALAWRSLEAPPTEQPPGEVELLVIRLEDGGILSKTGTEYWDTGEMHANRLQEKAFWSPDSKWLIREFSSRYSSDIVELYAIGKGDIVSGPFDLLKLVEPALRARLKTKLPKGMDAENFVFIFGSGKESKPVAAIDAHGNIHADVTFWAPKNGPTYYYSVTLKGTHEKDGPAARIVSVSYRGMEKADD